MAFRFPAAGTYTFDTQSGSDADAFLWTDPVGTEASLPQSPTVARRWNHETDDTLSTNIGPTSGAGGDPDGYVYSEASAPGAVDDDFIIEHEDTGSARTFDASANDITVEFKTNQRGDDNDANCFVETNENAAGWVTRATFGGSGDSDKVATAGSQIWASRSVDLTGLISHASTRIRIRIRLESVGLVWHCDYGLDEIVFIGVDQLTRELEGHQFRKDLSTVSDIGAQDTNATRTIGANTIFRGLTNMTGDAPAEALGTQYRVLGDADSEWRFIPLPP